MTSQKYTLGDKIGVGGYADVHKCRDTIGNRYVCKVMPKQNNKRIRVQREIEALKRVSRVSLRVPKYIDAIENDDHYYLVQEWCRGGSLKNYMNARNEIYENTVASIVRGVLRGLSPIHENGIIHRDIKAENILFTDNDDDAILKVCDFGLAIFRDFNSCLKY